MKFTDLLSDPQSVDEFDVLADKLASALDSIRGGNECESIAEILPESIAKAEEDYAALVLAVGNMNEFLKSPGSSELGKFELAPPKAGGYNPRKPTREDHEAMMRAAMESQEEEKKKQAAKHKPLNQFKQTKEDIQAMVDYGVS